MGARRDKMIGEMKLCHFAARTQNLTVPRGRVGQAL